MSNSNSLWKSLSHVPPGTEPRSPTWQADSSPSEASGKPINRSGLPRPPLSQVNNWLPERLSDLNHTIQRIWASQIVFVPSYTLLLNTHFTNQRWMCELLFIHAWMLEAVEEASWTVWVEINIQRMCFYVKRKSAQADSLVISWSVLPKPLWWWSLSPLLLLLNPWCLEFLGIWWCWSQGHPCV